MTNEHSEQELLSFARAMANMAAADGRVTEEERQQLDNVIAGIGLSPRDPEVAAIISTEFDNPGALSEIVAGIKNKELRAALVRLLVEMACADGELADEERAKINEAVQTFGFAADIVDDFIKWTIDSLELDAREQALMERLLG